VSAVSTGAASAADHVESLYQGEGSGENEGCTNETGVSDLTGNVEEWTRRRDGGRPDFHGNLKGRYWADTRTCQNSITGHGDTFRFYEIGFRCCRDL
jgi:formylglycine-generating enzyme required for sulfatase activity